MAEYAKTFPELDSSAGKEPSENEFLGSSESVGCGHNDGDHLAPFSTEEFPNQESGEGKGPA